MRERLDSALRRGVGAAIIGMTLGGCARSRSAEGTDGGRVSAAAHGTFEGTVQVSIRGTFAQATFELKGDKVRWSLLPTEPAAGYRIYDASAQRLFTIDSNAQAVVASEAAVPVDVPGPGGAWSLSPAAAPADRGAASAIAGHRCDRFVATSGSTTFDVCAASDMAPIPLEYAFPNVGTAIPFLGTLAARGLVPLEITRASGSAQRPSDPTLLTMQLRSAPIDDAELTVPSYPVTNVKRMPVPRAQPR
jgi:hypothetical protein